jgi:hypothetical protein
VTRIAKQIRQLAQQIAAVIDADPLWPALDAALRQIKGSPIARLPAWWRTCRKPVP